MDASLLGLFYCYASLLRNVNYTEIRSNEGHHVLKAIFVMLLIKLHSCSASNTTAIITGLEGGLMGSGGNDCDLPPSQSESETISSSTRVIFRVCEQYSLQGHDCTPTSA